jgi:hypothetical protein
MGEIRMSIDDRHWIVVRRHLRIALPIVFSQLHDLAFAQRHVPATTTPPTPQTVEPLVRRKTKKKRRTHKSPAPRCCHRG